MLRLYDLKYILEYITSNSIDENSKFHQNSPVFGRFSGKTEGELEDAA